MALRCSAFRLVPLLLSCYVTASQPMITASARIIVYLFEQLVSLRSFVPCVEAAERHEVETSNLRLNASLIDFRRFVRFTVSQFTVAETPVLCRLCRTATTSSRCRRRTSSSCFSPLIFQRTTHSLCWTRPPARTAALTTRPRAIPTRRRPTRHSSGVMSCTTSWTPSRQISQERR